MTATDAAAGAWTATRGMQAVQGGARACPARTTLFQCSVTALAMSSLLLVGCTPCTSYCLVYLRSVWTCEHSRQGVPGTGHVAVGAPGNAGRAWFRARGAQPGPPWGPKHCPAIGVLLGALAPAPGVWR